MGRCSRMAPGGFRTQKDKPDLDDPELKRAKVHVPGLTIGLAGFWMRLRLQLIE